MKKLLLTSTLLLSIYLYGQKTIVVNNMIFEDSAEETNRYGFNIFIQADLVYHNFDAFKPILEAYNTDLMNSPGLFCFGFGLTHKKWSPELDFGFSKNSGGNDSLNIRFNTTRYGLGLGYNLINSKRFLISPKTSIYWTRYRLINSNKEEVPLEQYVFNRDLDIRFNQLSGFVGLDIAYKFHDLFPWIPSTYWTIGFYGGYIFNINEKPWVFSPDKKILNDTKTGLKNFAWGFRVSFCN